MFDRKHVWRSGGLVAVSTMIVYLGLAARDIILARWFGISDTLDIFYIAMLWPMYVVAIIGQPFGEVFTVQFNKIKSKQNSDISIFIAESAGLITSILLVLSILIGLFLSDIVLAIGWKFDASKQAEVVGMVLYLLPLIIMSGIVILANSLLNAIGKHAIASFSPVVVPIFALIAVVVFSSSYGVKIVAIGMTIGQVVNLVVVVFALYKAGYVIYPRIKGIISRAKTSFSLYLPYIIVAFCVTSLVPTDQLMSSGLEAGSVSTYTLGAKVVYFITALSSTVLTMVLFPFFSHHISEDRGAHARDELIQWVSIATFVMIPVSILFILFSEDIISILYVGREFKVEDVSSVSLVMDVSLIQLPFMIVNLVIMKYLVADKKVITITIPFGCALILNIIMNYVFMREYGINGIAAATSISVIFTTIILLILGKRRNDIPVMNIRKLIPAWCLFIFAVLTFLSYKHEIIGLS